MTRTIDLNADMGESYGHFVVGNDAAVMPLITSASLACGFHGGDPATMRASVAAAVKNGVAIGAHPGLPDLEGFGRRRIEVSPAEVGAYLTYQLGALDGFLRPSRSPLHHVKLHGAFAAMVLNEADLAEAAVTAIAAHSPGTMLYVPAPVDRYPATELARRSGLRVISEAYVDLRYQPDGSLRVIRDIHTPDPEAVVARAVRIATTSEVDCADGTVIAIEAQTICIHGDNPEAPHILARIRDELTGHGIVVAAV